MHKTQSGNAVIFILIAIVLFGALIFTFTNSGQQSISRMSKNEIRIEAQEILFYAQSAEKAVQRVRQNGCSETQISFQYDADEDGDYNDSGGELYYNSNSPTDHSCHVFHPDGGKGVRLALGNNRMFSGYRTCIRGIGNHNCDGTGRGNDIALYVQVSLETCQELNYQIGTRDKGESPPADNLSFNYNSNDYNYDGVFDPVNGSTFDLNGTAITNEYSSCVEDTVGSPGGYNFYRVMVAR